MGGRFAFKGFCCGQEPAGAVKCVPAEAVKLSPQVGQGCKESWQCGKAGCRGLGKTVCSLRGRRTCASNGEEEERLCVLDAHADFDHNL